MVKIKLQNVIRSENGRGTELQKKEKKERTRNDVLCVIKCWMSGCYLVVPGLRIHGVALGGSLLRETVCTDEERRRRLREESGFSIGVAASADPSLGAL